jgi:hypothetical protein
MTIPLFSPAPPTHAPWSSNSSPSLGGQDSNGVWSMLDPDQMEGRASSSASWEDISFVK